jgi:hypothetical protein
MGTERVNARNTSEWKKGRSDISNLAPEMLLQSSFWYNADGDQSEVEGRPTQTQIQVMDESLGGIWLLFLFVAWWISLRRSGESFDRRG